ncbi:hypothetical protein CBR_g48776 [Chara braunii]|uniref:Spindle and kinetochore-associated protein 1 homolog n=1 Tax=Chara braunii TaxID=69332 RepID=A0A388M3F1_CHABU|nr:hypothetical protein CBR_g48776 [Chara braunii]|eukprot:GBG89066.1 hypothetical protein CBR_g48776 [Chara braunii]
MDKTMEDLEAMSEAFHDMLFNFDAILKMTMEKYMAARVLLACDKQDIEELADDVHRAALLLKDVKAAVHREQESLPILKGMVDSLELQRKRLRSIKANLPECLRSTQGGGAMQEALEGDGTENAQQQASKPKAKGRKGPPPRCYVSETELSAVSSYMRGRLTLQKVNTAIDEMAEFAASNAQLLAMAKKQPGKANSETMKKCQELKEIALADDVRGHHFFLETDLRGQVLKMDHTSKAIITVSEKAIKSKPT